MHTNIIYKKSLPLYFVSIINFLFTLSIAFQANAQVQSDKAIGEELLDGGEWAICDITVTSKDQAGDKSDKQQASRMGKKKNEAAEQHYQLEPNEFGLFESISGIQSQGKIAVVIAYSEGNVGEKVAIIVQDGGTLDNGKKVKVAQLDSQKKISFDFRVTDSSGIYRVMLRKGSDTKVVQLWIDSDFSAPKN